MEIRIKDTIKTPMWAIMKDDNNNTPVFFLSSEKNDFIPIDHTTLSPYQQQTLWYAIKMKIIEAKDDTVFQESFKATLKAYLEKRQKNQATEFKSFFGTETPKSVNPRQAVDAVAKANQMKKLLENSTSTLKKLFRDLTASDLELCIKIEQLGKCRKTVLKLISEETIRQTKENTAKIENPNAPDMKEFEKRQIYKGYDKRLLSNISNVRESEEEQVIIKIGNG
jgi:hypothetical protein